jgi:hypothetical protein
MFSHQNSVCTSLPSYALYMPCQSHVPWFHHPNNISLGIAIQSYRQCYGYVRAEILKAVTVFLGFNAV